MRSHHGPSSTMTLKCYFLIAPSVLIASSHSVSAQTFSGMIDGTTGVGQGAVSLFFLLTAISALPAVGVTVTCFPFIVTVLSILRQSIGLQQSPPNMLIVGLALFLTWFIMEPVLLDAWTVALKPFWNGEIPIQDAFLLGLQPFRGFMEARTDPDVVVKLAEYSLSSDSRIGKLSTLIPSFMISELQRAFEIGFLVALPFLIIDLVISSVLMSMGMMMLPPAVVALPFKLAFFAVVDGWSILAGAMINGYQ